MNTVHKVLTGLALGAGLMISAPQGAQAADLARMGTTQEAGPFQVTLIGEPKTGSSRFEARVTRDGRAVSDANVTLSLSMPNHRHGATVKRLRSDTALNVAGGQYAGSARLMQGTNQARVSVSAGGEKGSARYQFEARRRPYVAHLGMWHPAGGFEVRLITVPESTIARSGANRFRVQVAREGYPVTDANVSVHFTMPTMPRMGSADSYAKLTAQNGAYEGTAKLAHAAPWRAHITVKSGDAKGYATYDFPAR